MMRKSRAVLALKLLSMVLFAAAAAMPISNGYAATFSDGTHAVGGGIAPGTYRTRVAPASFYWARLSGFGGTLDETIAKSFITIRQVVTILGSDLAFETDCCENWTRTLTAITPSPTSPFGDEMYILDTGIAAGTRTAPRGASWYWERLSSFGGTAPCDLSSCSPTIPGESRRRPLWATYLV